MSDQYKDWYVLSVRTNKESFIKNEIEKYTDYQYKLMIFTKKLLHINNKKIKTIIKPLFPGYIFLHRNIDEIITISKKILPTQHIKPICVNGKPCKVYEHEMEFLLTTTKACGIFELSNYYKRGDKVEIIDGPLKELKGNILFINEKKRKVKIQIHLFDRPINLSLGMNNIC